MSFLVVRASKLRADSKLGFTYSTANGCTTITSVNHSGLFGGTGLKEGQSVLTINGSSAKGIGGIGMQKLLASLGEGEVTIVVENPPGASEKATFEYNVHRDEKTLKVTVRGKKMSETRPQILVDAGVPNDEWSIVRSLIVADLMTASLKCVEHSAAYANLPNHHFSRSDNTQDIIKQSRGMMVSMMYYNATIVALSVNHRVNSILGKYGVAAVLEYEPFESINKEQLMVATGFAFHRMG